MRKLLCLLAIAAVVSPAATFTPVEPSLDEPDLTEILDTIYGAGNYFRIDDDSDQLWQAGQITVWALATFSGATERLGFCVVCDGSDDTLFDQSFSADGIFSAAMTVGGASDLFVASQFTWFDFAQSFPTVGKVYSDPARNPAAGDHMVTYGLFGQPNTFVIGVEDWLFTNPNGDRDYQDFVFQVNYTRNPPDIHTPEPGALLTLAGGLVALLCVRRKRGAA